MSTNQGRGDHDARRKRRPLWFRIGRAILFGYVLVLLGLVVFESRLVYPGAYLNMDQRDWDDGQNDVVPFAYESPDGPRLVGQLLRHDGSRHIVFFHGNGTKAAWSRPFIRRLAEATEASVLAAEYRGYGDDGGRPHEAGLVADSLAGFDAYCERAGVPPEQVFVYGSSLGGGCAAAVAQARPVRGVILERTFDRLVDVAAGIYWYMPVRLLMRNRFDSVERLADYEGPVLMIHGEADSVVPIAHARKLAEALDAATPQRLEFVEVPGLGHNDYLEDETLHRVGDWMRGKP